MEAIVDFPSKMYVVLLQGVVTYCSGILSCFALHNGEVQNASMSLCSVIPNEIPNQYVLYAQKRKK